MSEQQQQAEYYFGLGVGPNDYPALEAVKTWMEDETRLFATQTIAEYGMFDEADLVSREFDDLRDRAGLQTAMHRAWR